MPRQDNTPPPANAGQVDEERASAYRVGDVIVFKYEGNVRAEVTGHQVVGGRVWVEARAADVRFLVPAHQVVGVEPQEVL